MAISISAELGAFLDKDHAARAGRVGYVSFNWYRALDSAGTVVAFRFSKGAAPQNFLSYVTTQGLDGVTGPYKTRKAALA